MAPRSPIKFSLMSLLLCCVILGAYGIDLLAQARGRVRISSPGRLRTVGRSNVMDNFLSTSYGLGKLRGPSRGRGEGILRSSISQRTLGRGSSIQASRARRGGGTDPYKLSGAGPKGSSRVYAPSGGRIVMMDGTGTGGGRRLSSIKQVAVGSAQAYLEAVGTASIITLADPNKPINSLVPAGAGLYHNLLAEGEAAFRESDFVRASSRFYLANIIGERNPESLLSLMHARFALATVAYSEPAHYLSRAMKYFPELPLVPLRPRAFFENQITYLEHLHRLKKHTRNVPYDAGALFLLTYFQWFNEEVDAARDSLARAATHAKRPELVEAIDIFWEGMLASDKVSGSLWPTTQPTTTTAPAGEESPTKTEPAAAATAKP